MGDSEGLFRLRWFLLGSMAALLIARALGITVHPVRSPPTQAVDEAPKAVPIAQRRTPTPSSEAVAPSASESAQPMDAPPIATPPRATPAGTPTPDASTPDVGRAPKPALVSDEARSLLDQADDAIARLRSAPRDGAARIRVERLLDRLTHELPSEPRAEARRCLTQASFEGQAEAAAHLLVRCARQIHEAFE